MDSDKLLEIEDLKTHFFVDEGVLAAVDGVSLTIDRHKTVGIIGESGCGKTVMAQSVLQIVPPPGKSGLRSNSPARKRRTSRRYRRSRSFW